MISDAAVSERGYVLAAGRLPPVVHHHPRSFALAGVRGQDLTVALISRTLTHVQLASVEVVLGVDLGPALFEQG